MARGGNKQTNLDIAYKVPLQKHRQVLHVGDLDISRRNSQGHSHEGATLSVSLHPQSWRKIARLGSAPVWKITRKDGQEGSFLDVHKLSIAQTKQIEEWAIQEGLVKRQGCFVHTYFDDEWEQEFENVYLSREEALEEGDIDDLVEKKVLVPTPSLAAFSDAPHTEQAFVFDHVLVAWASKESFDGVWWQDTLDETRLSAPRGGILQNKLSLWNFEQIIPDLKAPK